MEQMKERVVNYWSARTESFRDLRIREFEGKMHERWLSEFQKYIPMDRSLRVLDLGTGTGFFALLLSQQGHQVVGIDLTESMIETAKHISEVMNLPAEFYVMDAEHPDFEPEQFDVLVTRNLTWTLPHLPEAYANWHKLLKKDGILINFDADYCREKNDQPLPEKHAHKDVPDVLKQEYEYFKDALRVMQKPRPQWDRELLQEAGFRDVQTDLQVWERIYCDYDEFYNPTPIFTISAKA